MATGDLLTIPHLNRKALRRIFIQIDRDPSTGCWVWNGLRSESGYGKVTVSKVGYATHRLMYAWLVEPLPTGLGRDVKVLDHVVCDNKACCNPAHLILTTARENLLRANGTPALNARKTHCKRGHLLPTTRNRNGSRVCTECMRRHGKMAWRAAIAAGAEGDALKAKLAAQQRARMNGPRRAELLKMKRDHYHANKHRHQATLPDLKA